MSKECSAHYLVQKRSPEFSCVTHSEVTSFVENLDVIYEHTYTGSCERLLLVCTSPRRLTVAARGRCGTTVLTNKSGGSLYMDILYHIIALH